jgi:hypothetical protein
MNGASGCLAAREGEGCYGVVQSELEIPVGYVPVSPIAGKFALPKTLREKAPDLNSNIPVEKAWQLPESQALPVLSPSAWRIREPGNSKKNALPQRILDDSEEQGGGTVEKIDSLRLAAEQRYELAPGPAEPYAFVV